MKIRRALLNVSVLAAVSGVAGGALWVTNVPAQVAASAAQVDATALTAAMLAPNAVMRAWNTALVPVSGVVSGSPESVTFSGTAKVATRLAPDPDFGAPSLVISIDLTGLSGVGSSTPRTKYVIGGPEILQQRLAPTHSVDITFPFYPSGTMGTTGARSGTASFTFSVDGTTGEVSGAAGSIASSPL